MTFKTITLDISQYICPITLELCAVPVFATPCGHLFEQEAIETHLESSNQCPCCKKDIKTTSPAWIIKEQIDTLITQHSELRNTQYFPSNKLRQCIINNDLENVKQILLKRPELLNMLIDEQTMLMAFTNLGNLIAVQYLVSIGAHINQFNRNLETVLMVTAYHGNQKIMHYLLENNADLNLASGCFPEYDEHQRKVSYFYDGYTALHRAARNGHAECCRILIKSGASLVTLNAKGKEPASIATGEAIPVFQEPETIYRLVRARLDACAVNSVIEVLVNRYYQDQQGKVILDHCIKNIATTHPSFLDTIQSQVTLRLKKTNLLREITLNHTDRALQILKKNKQLLNDALDDQGLTALLAFAWQRNLDGVTYLIQKGVNLNQTGVDNHTALMIAALKGDLPIIQSLLTAGACVHKCCEIKNVNPTDFTALHLAAQSGSLTCCLALIQAGASIYSLNSSGQTPAQVAKNEAIAAFESKQEETVEAIKPMHKESQTLITGNEIAVGIIHAMSFIIVGKTLYEYANHTIGVESSDELYKNWHVFLTALFALYLICSKSSTESAILSCPVMRTMQRLQSRSSLAFFSADVSDIERITPSRPYSMDSD